MDANRAMPTRAEQPLVELVVQNGRHAGSRCPLHAPVTCIGRASGNDIRLNGEDIDPLHCLLAVTVDGLVARDLNSSTGIEVNGTKISTAILKEGDVLAIGPMQFRVGPLAGQSAGENPPQETPGQRDALRLQAAAVAAQQAALEEEEVRLQQQQAALQQHEQELAAHLEEKRRKLVELSERVQAERQALQHDRAAYEKQVEKITGDLTQTQRELMEDKHKVQTERSRLKSLHKRLRQRWHRFWLAERQAMTQRQAELVEQARLLELRAQDLERHDEKLQAKRLRFNTLYELGRRHLQEAWTKLKLDRSRWKHRRGRERLALKLRQRDAEEHDRKLVAAQRLFLREKSAWDARKSTLEAEVTGLDQRALNQRQVINEQTQALARLTEEIQARTTPWASALAQSAPGDAAVASSQDATSLAKKKKKSGASGSTELAEERRRLEVQYQERQEELTSLAGDLADQRWQMVEQWQRLVLLQRHWDEERQAAAGELEEVAQRLLAHGQFLDDKEQSQDTREQTLRQRHQELAQLRQQMIAWRARLRARDQAWEGAKGQLLAEVQQRESLAEQQLAVLVDLRQRWAKRRKEEVDKVRHEHAALEDAQKDLTRQRMELAQRGATLEEDRRLLTERTLALEQMRKEVMPAEDQPRAERRLERLRRRWISQQAGALRSLTRERDGLKDDLKNLEVLQAQVQKRAADLASAEADLTERLASYEHKQSLALTRQARLQEELTLAAAQRAQTEQQLAKLHDEIERIARSLYDEPEAPTQSLESAA